MGVAGAEPAQGEAVAGGQDHAHRRLAVVHRLYLPTVDLNLVIQYKIVRSFNNLSLTKMLPSSRPDCLAGLNMATAKMKADKSTRASNDYLLFGEVVQSLRKSTYTSGGSSMYTRLSARPSPGGRW